MKRFVFRIISVLIGGVVFTSCSDKETLPVNILGKYKIQADCIVEGVEDYSESHTYEIEIVKNRKDNSNIKFFLDQHGVEEYVKAKMLNEYDFDIFAQQFTKKGGFNLHFIGYGNIDENFIFMHYSVSSENVYGILKCDCTGKKID